VIAEEAARLRREYGAEGLVEAHMAADPFAQFDLWLSGVYAADLEEPTAFVLATTDPDGRPSARALLMKEFSSDGLVFYTGLSSRKSRELSSNPRAAATFVWIPLHRQVRFEGAVESVDTETADAYFATRPRGAQLAAHASSQSAVVTNREELEARYSQLDAEFGEADIPRPQHWGGWRLVPDSVEFWQGRENRFHDRVRYRRNDGEWSKERLAP
jgi:pyridoxamine 5'-phosphate oxidase